MKTISTRVDRIIRLSVLWALFFGGFTALLTWSFWLWLPSNEIAHGVMVNSIDLSTYSEEAARARLKDISPPESEQITVHLDEADISTSSAGLGLHTNIDDAVGLAIAYGHQGSWLEQASERTITFFTPAQIPLKSEYDPIKVNEWVEKISAQVHQDGEDPHVVVKGNTFTVNPGKAGTTVDEEALVSTILANPQEKNFSLPMKPSRQPLTAEETATAQTRVDTFKGKTVVLQPSDKEQTVSIPASEFVTWLEFPNGFRDSALQTAIDKWSKQYDHEAVNAEFALGQGNQLTKFRPQENGRALDQTKLIANLKIALNTLETDPKKSETVAMEFKETPATITLDQLNNQGIKELLGVGTSEYFHSIPNRVFNVGLTSQKVGARLIQPDEEFSFANTVGDISAASGFKSAYVIQNGHTVLGDGGGVCQVSTTVFRAILNAGFPITKWKNHSYRVGYYEENSKPGFDATIFAPSVDLRFKNDGDHAIVVNVINDTDNRFMRVEIWGTKDGRVSTIDNYSLTNIKPAPAALYQPDPSLKTGTTQQIDFAAGGATANFNYSVKNADGTVRFARNFKSVYQPWQAVYLVGTG